MMGIRIVDLFAGGGGLSLGFTQAGFEVVAAIENWKPAVAVYAANFTDHPVIELDLSDEYKAASIIQGYQPDMIMGGPPCQDFSSAGKRDESQGRASLTLSFANLISRCKPRFFLMENVARAATSETFKTALDVFKRAGYGLTIKVLDAAYCGAPQLRKRLIVVGSLDERDGFLDAALDQGLSAEPMTLRKYFRNRLPFEHYYRHPRSYARRGVFSVDEPSPTIRGVNRPIPRGYPGHEGDTVAISESLRCLTTQERARIQTFPASFKLPGCKTDVEQVLGNAVPVKLAEYVAKHLSAYIDQLEVPCQLGVAYQNQLFEPRKRFASRIKTAASLTPVV
jgi:DNA (cytosine-5)-methyltransferase 1